MYKPSSEFHLVPPSRNFPSNLIFSFKIINSTNCTSSDGLVDNWKWCRLKDFSLKVFIHHIVQFVGSSDCGHRRSQFDRKFRQNNSRKSNVSNILHFAWNPSRSKDPPVYRMTNQFSQSGRDELLFIWDRFVWSNLIISFFFIFSSTDFWDLTRKYKCMDITMNTLEYLIYILDFSCIPSCQNISLGRLSPEPL